MSTAFEEKVKRCATALAGYRAAILFNFSFQHKGAYNQKKELLGLLFEWVAQFLVSQIKSERIYL